jgi:hypothetical protein
MAARKIAIAAIERLQRTLESTPECQIAEVTKSEAIRMLSPQIHAMQSKGYGLGVIAGVLSENGVAVTPVTLKGYLKQLRAAGGKKSARKRAHRKGPGDSPTTNPVGVSAMGGGARDDVAPSSPKAAREGAAGLERGQSAGASSGAVSAVATTSKGSPRSMDEGAPRRSAFVPKEDTRDI